MDQPAFLEHFRLRCSETNRAVNSWRDTQTAEVRAAKQALQDRHQAVEDELASLAQEMDRFLAKKAALEERLAGEQLDLQFQEESLERLNQQEAELRPKQEALAEAVAEQSRRLGLRQNENEETREEFSAKEKDLSRAIEYYQDVLGIKLVPNPDGYLVELGYFDEAQPNRTFSFYFRVNERGLFIVDRPSEPLASLSMLVDRLNANADLPRFFLTLRQALGRSDGIVLAR